MGGKPDGKHHATRKSGPARQAATRKTQTEAQVVAALQAMLRQAWAEYNRQKNEGQ